MVFKQGYMSTLQDAIGAGDDLDMGLLYVTCQLCRCAYGMLNQTICHPKTGHMASHNRAYGIPK